MSANENKHGGHRPGAGRKPGSKNKSRKEPTKPLPVRATEAERAAMEAAASAVGLSLAAWANKQLVKAAKRAK